MSRAICITGVPMDLGQGRRGVDMGPSAIRYAGLNARLAALGFEVNDSGNLDVPVPEEQEDGAAGGMRHLAVVSAVNRELADRTAHALQEEALPLTLGGDHSIAAGSIVGVRRHGPSGVLWIDAHGDFNTPRTSPSGNIHGMPLAALCGLGEPRLVDLAWPGAKVRPEDVVLIGVRDLDGEERRLMREAGVTVYTMTEVDHLGLPEVATRTFRQLEALPRVHLSFDADVLDPEIAPGVGTPVPGGLTFREAHLLMELFADWGRVTSLDLVEVNPILDRANVTANTLVGLTLSLLGKKIY